MSIRPNFMNDKQSFVSEALDGLVMLNNEKLERLKGTQIIRLKQSSSDTVSLISGGGSGHEPAHAGFVHPFMLTAAVCGGVFASPSHQEVLTAIKNVPNKQGVLLIIKNYTGDVINFELAASIARSQGINVESIVFGDDIAFQKDKRGLAGAVLLYKILGSFAQQKYPLDKLRSLGERIALKIQTIGVSLSSCSIPGNPSTFMLPENHLEIGLGIHGEKGKQQKPIGSAREIVKDMLDSFGEHPKDTRRVVLLLNNLGSTTDLEMGVIAREVLILLHSRNFIVSQAISGRIMTSLEMHGFSLTLLPMDFGDETDKISQAIEHQIDNGNWTTLKQVNQTPDSAIQHIETIDDQEKDATQQLKQFSSVAHELFTAIFSGLADQFDYFNKLDALVGDGDTGEGVLRSCNAVLNLLPTLDLMNEFRASLSRIAEEIASTFGGTSGALYGVFLLNGSRDLNDNFIENDSYSFSKGLEVGMKKLSQVGNSNKGDRTMLDVLFAMHETLESLLNSSSNNNNNNNENPLDVHLVFEALVQAAKESSKNTSHLKAKKGRSRYLDGREIGNLDPGCEIIVSWLSIAQKFYSTP